VRDEKTKTCFSKVAVIYFRRFFDNRKSEVIAMFWQWLAVFGISLVGCAIILLLNFWQIKQSASLTIFGLTFTSYWTYLAFFLAVFAPLILAANYFFFSAFYLGFRVWRDVFGDKYWIVNLTNSSAIIFVILILTWLCFQELPTKGALAGFILAIAAVLVSVLWK
jgi:hypothetical protein